jgi:2-polyprenyl-3-methyl-5-hydroxy-6-metoxy-1,4-benzoquinol methylase
MASSFADQIPVVVHVVQQLRPRTILDIGKGFGKYGFLLHEYLGIDTEALPEASRTLAEQSRLKIDAVESNPAYLWPHLSHAYGRVICGRIEELYEGLQGYDLVLMLDVIEHLQKPDALRILQHFLRDSATLIVSSPREFFQQELYASEDEHHVSHWTPSDFKGLAKTLFWQNVGAGRVYVLSDAPMARIRGFGNDPLTVARRIGRLLRSELS